MSNSRKFQVGSTFLLGAFVVVAGIIRCIFSESSVSELESLDITFQRAPAIYWTVIEACIGVISCCLPTYRPLISHYKIGHVFTSFNKYLSSSDRYTKPDDSGDAKHYPGAQSHTELVEVRQGERNHSNRGIMVERNATQVHDAV